MRTAAFLLAFCAAGAAVPAGFSALFASLSTSKTETAVSIATKDTKLASTKTLRPLRPGKSGRRRGMIMAEVSANRMNAPPTTARPILFPVDSPASSTGLFHQIVRLPGAGQPSAAARTRGAQRRSRAG